MTQVWQEVERNRLACEALADVDAGWVIDHEAIHEWAESLGEEMPLRLPRHDDAP